MTIRTTALNEFEHKYFAELGTWNHTSYPKQRLKVNWGLHAVSGYVTMILAGSLSLLGWWMKPNNTL